jgi:IS30 family transposase
MYTSAIKLGRTRDTISRELLRTWSEYCFHTGFKGGAYLVTVTRLLTFKTQ